MTSAFHMLNWTLPDGKEVQAPAWLNEEECNWFWTSIELQIQSGQITDLHTFGMQAKAVWETASRNAAEADAANGFGLFNKPEFYDKKDGLEKGLRERTKSIWYSPGEFVQVWDSPVERFRDTYQGIALLIGFKCAVGYAFGYPIELWRVEFKTGDLEGQIHNCKIWASGRSIVVQDPSESLHDRMTKDRLPHPPGTLIFKDKPPLTYPLVWGKFIVEPAEFRCNEHGCDKTVCPGEAACLIEEKEREYLWICWACYHKRFDLSLNNDDWLSRND